MIKFIAELAIEQESIIDWQNSTIDRMIDVLADHKEKDPMIALLKFHSNKLENRVNGLKLTTTWDFKRKELRLF